MSHPAPHVPSAPDVQLADDAQRPVRRALLSVYDKTGLVELATALHAAGVALVSTGSTASTIAAAGVPVTKVEDLTGFPECLEGRVKTLHPRVHAGILADSRKADHLAQLDELGIAPFELVVVNLYPFAATVASGAGPDEVVEQIDIGGPSMVRAAAKNHPSVAVVVDPARYDDVVAAVRDGGFTFAQRKRLAAQAFAHTAQYDVAVASWFASSYAPDGPAFPAFTGATWERADVLRYGENPHQQAALYTHWRGGLATATQLQGKAMSYNNYVDADAARRAAYDHTGPAVAVVKHNNPCGVATDDDIAAAYRKAHATDPVSAYGGVVAANRVVTTELAEALKPVFTEVVVAPGYEDGALEIFASKKNLRVLVLPEGAQSDPVEFRPISGGLLVQTIDHIDGVVTAEDGTVSGGDDPQHWTLVTGEAADDATIADLAFAWRAIRAAKSNAILLARDGAAVGVGMGQVNRVDSCRLAVERANTLADGEERARGAVAASDAFFPFADGLQILLDAGVRAVVAPGGSIRDAEVIEAAQAAGVTMYFTGTRHFAH
ncbi:bifunctional phosphoribosylaminoimidazolecarboxamide formyltransferase/IMP cyclohydrolase [Cellulosimicrobium cellulans]|uniref:Bifunctional purine biosynthesis protein PurH n=1 Tax=Cellulosimicrobium cellulans TaxID=1710 RepID=A0A1Y0HW66_CELCE|nr:bifunctional phosphoribosylaminoimidazolecarboxamide formyltransferase/IMP cyclohydrolase [Cellulosimicrobium cellulans]ARU52428.1 bifunctional phosphoribosylaminoimidazolecarboxamide formyltransferase/IMP cyclohydrolase [Cellulosimicrobium cellulans]